MEVVIFCLNNMCKCVYIEMGSHCVVLVTIHLQKYNKKCENQMFSPHYNYQHLNSLNETSMLTSFIDSVERESERMSELAMGRRAEKCCFLAMAELSQL